MVYSMEKESLIKHDFQAAIIVLELATEQNHNLLTLFVTRDYYWAACKQIMKFLKTAL